MKKLEGKELYRRLQEARNAKKLLTSAHALINELRKKNKNLEKIIALQAEQIKTMGQKMENQALCIENLEKIAFGKSKKNNKNDDMNQFGGQGQSQNKQAKRDKKSYQREIPKKITETKKYELNCCPDCGSPLCDKKITERYMEDIVLPEKFKNPLKNVEKQLIETGWCGVCKTRKSAININGSKVFLGNNVKILTVYLSVIMRMSYEQIRNIFRDIYHIKLSDGEIENILEGQGNKLTHEHKKIDTAAQDQPSHYDETTYKIAKGKFGNYCWIKTAVKTTDTVFLIGKTRGKGNAKVLKGKSDQVGITDDYAGYNSLFESHQLCWAHPLRKLRDLKDSKTIQGKAKENCKKTYTKFKKLYEELKNLKNRSKEKKEKYLKRFNKIAEIHKNDPEKLKTYKTTLKKQQQKYFTFFEKEGIPMDNNQAERRLRHIVLKRKISFGCKTDKGARIWEKLFSVALTWWWRDPVNFISNYRHLLA